jgi:hypothetical protein
MVVRSSFGAVELMRRRRKYGNAATFHVHDGCLVISRVVNEFGIAKKVAAAIEEVLGTKPAS